MLRLRFDDFSRATRSQTLSLPTDQTDAILVAARDLVTTAWPLIERQGLTLVGVSLANLDNDGFMQLTLPFAPENASSLDAALDEIKERFGSTAITRAVLLGREPRWLPPLLPD